MAVFSYKALDARRNAVKGTVAADTLRQARDALRGRGLRVESIREHASARRVRWWTRLAAGHSANRWATCVHELAMLLWAGIPLLEALDTVLQQQRGRFRTALLAVREQVAAGVGLAQALRARPDLFDPLSIHLIEVGEDSGNLELALDQLAGFQRRYSQIKDRVITALLYPAFLLVFACTAAVFLMTYVLPTLLENLAESLETLPWPTRVVKGTSDLLLAHGLWLTAGAALAVAAVGVALQTRTGRRLWHRLLLRLPIVGPMALKQNLSRMAMIIATLLRSGVVLTKALELAARSTPNLLLREALEQCGRAVEAGQDVATALAGSGVVPPLAVRVFSVGQESGRLEEMLERLAADYEQQVGVLSARLTALLEPVLIVVLAVLVGFVLVATILPILEAGHVL
jgi:type II secretory pathway component PulF